MTWQQRPGAPPERAPVSAETRAEFSGEMLEWIAAAETALLALESRPGDPEPLDTAFRAFHTLKGTAPFVGLEETARLAHAVEDLIVRARRGEIRLRGGYADLVFEACDALRAQAERLAARPLGDVAPVPGHLLERLHRPEAFGIGEDAGAASVPRLGDLLVAQGRAAREEVERAAREQGDQPIGVTLVRRGVVAARTVAEALRSQRRLAEGAAPSETVRVPLRRIEALADRVAALRTACRRERAAQGGGEGSLGALLDDLEEAVAALARAPVRELFDRLARPARDLARRWGLRVRLECVGGDIELDRAALQALRAPLVHLVRNAIAHGIEPPAERLAAGKPPEGTIGLRCYLSGEEAVIEVSDDGRGLDRRSLLERVSAQSAAAPPLDDARLFALLLEGGISTVETSTELAGRGVGLGAVAESVRALGGTLNLESVKGRGARFTVRLPRRTTRARDGPARGGSDRRAWGTGGDL